VVGEPRRRLAVLRAELADLRDLLRSATS
jgi:hypothetical protein